MIGKQMKADLHNHLGRNGANPGFDETIDLVYNKLGENFAFGICNSTPTDYRFENFVNQKGKYERVWLDDEKRFLLVPEKQIYVVGAEEVVTKQGHLVVVGMPSNKKIQKNDKTLSLEDALESAGDFNGIRIAPHPFSRDGLGNYLLDDWSKNAHEGDTNCLFRNFDGWEVYNASAELSIPKILPSSANENSMELYNKLLVNNYDIGACAFTDGHSVGVIGKSYTVLDLENISIDSLRQAINSSGDFIYYNNINESFETLHMKPAKWDALKHLKNMVLTKAGLLK